MSEAADTAAKALAGRSRRRLFSPRTIIVIALLLIVAAAACGGAWYFIVRGPATSRETPPPNDPPLPSYLTIKPFVVSMVNSSGGPHFVQLGFELTLSDSAAGNVVNAVLPEVQDAMRRTLLGFQVDDVVTPAGIDKVRAALLRTINQVLVKRLGAERAKRLSGGDGNAGIVEDIYFSTLVVE